LIKFGNDVRLSDQPGNKEFECERVYYRARSAALSNEMNYHLSAIVWRNKKPITIRTNIEKSHPSCKRTFESGDETASLHAEMNALRFAKPGDDIEVLRWGKTDQLRCSKPCKMCHAAMVRAGIRMVTYVDRDGNKTKMKLN
jgi:tRNA(Arg) A34 adenosine deaminase TadA